jgi:hypothetical protein
MSAAFSGLGPQKTNLKRKPGAAAAAAAAAAVV